MNELRPFELVIAETPEEVAFRAASWFVEASRRAIEVRGRFLVALAGGSTPKRTYESLASRDFRERLNWRKIQVYWGDERCVAPDDERSNYRFVRETLLEHVPLPEENIHRMRAEVEPKSAAEEYERHLPEALDFIWLGVGADGHVASLFPHHPALRETSRRVLAVSVDNDLPRRLTLTFMAINRAREVQMLVVGRAKANVLERALRGPLLPEEYPCQGVHPRDRLVWIVDKQAASQLPDRG